MGKITHQSVTEFGLRVPIAGLAILDGITPVRDAIENASPATGKTVIETLLTLAREQDTSGQLVLHTTDFHRIRHLARSLERLSAPTGLEGGDSNTVVADRIRTALAADPVISTYFDVGGEADEVSLTAKADPEAANDSTLNIAYTNGTAAGLTPDATSNNTTAGVAGVKQKETATAAGTLSGSSGTVSVTVTAAGMPNSPKEILVETETGDTAAVWAGKVREALAADEDIAGFFTVGGSTTAIELTRKVDAANDATMNIALDNGTSTGVTPAASSADTTAGVAGVAQVETATIVGSATRDGVIEVTVTAAVMTTSSPRTIGVQVQGAVYNDVVITDDYYADAKADSDPAEESLRAALVELLADYIPGFTGVGITNAGEF